MLWFCLKCRRNKESKSAKLTKASKVKLILLGGVRCTIVKSKHL